jgi:serine/threonine protein kinase
MIETENTPDWNSLSGVILDGGYELKEILEAQKELAIIRVRVLGDYTLSAFATFYLLPRPDAKRQVEYWQTLRGFTAKSNLSIPLGSGVVTLNTSCLAYLISQNAEETLAEVIENRTLSPEETTEVVRSLARGLEELHGHNLVHGAIAPAEIWAIGDDIKLTTDTVREVDTEPLTEFRNVKYLAPENSKHNLTPAADMWCFGASVYEAATRKAFDKSHPEEIDHLPHPLALLVERCTDEDPAKRCKADDIEGILRTKTPPPKPKPVPPAIVPEAAIVDTAEKSPLPQAVLPLEDSATKSVAAESTETSVAAPQASTHIPASAAAEEITGDTPNVPSAVRPQKKFEASDASDYKRAAAVEPKPTLAPAQKAKQTESPFASSAARNESGRIPDDEKTGTFGGGRGWIYAIAAFLAIFFLLWLVRGHSAKKPAPVTASSPQASTSPSPEGKPAWQTHTLSPDSKSTGPAPQTKSSSKANRSAAPIAAPVAASATSDKNIWRVIFYTYNRQEDAASKAQDINARHPDLQVQVFSSQADSGPFLVVAAGQATKLEAARLRLRALREGMPRDSYIQNYNH